LYSFPHISCLDWPGRSRSGLAKPNVVYGQFLALRGPSLSFADHSCLPPAVLRLPGQLVGPALGIFADHSCSFPALFRLVYVFSAGFSGLLFGLGRIILVLLYLFLVRGCPFHYYSYPSISSYIPSVEPQWQLPLSAISVRARALVLPAFVSVRLADLLKQD